MATLGMMYPARGGLVSSQMRGVLSEVRGSTPPRGVCITYCFLPQNWYFDRYRYKEIFTTGK